jgi:hypothetical protein
MVVTALAEHPRRRRLLLLRRGQKIVAIRWIEVHYCPLWRVLTGMGMGRTKGMRRKRKRTQQQQQQQQKSR